MGMKFKLFTESPNFLKVLAFFLALILWFFVAGDRQDVLGLEVRRTFSGIPLTYRNLGQDLVIVGLEEGVTLSLQGVPQAFDGLTPADLEAYVDLNGKREGRYELRINATAPRGLSIVSIEPAKANVLLEDLITRQMSVEGDLLGEPAGGLIVQEINFTPAEVFIRGPRRKIDLVEKVIFRLNVSGAEGNIADSARLYPLDDRDNFIQGITIIPDSVEVEVSFTLPQKDLPVEAVFSSNGRRVETVIVEPSVVTVVGPSHLLEEITRLLTEEIDLKERDSVFTAEVPLVLPEGIISPKNDRVKVRVYLAD
jgi:YbbR domain-containing protein